MVFVRTGGHDSFIQIQHGQIKEYIEASCWRIVNGDGFLVGDSVQVLSRDGTNTSRVGVITHMKWDLKSEKIIYFLDEPLKKEFRIEDLKKWRDDSSGQSNLKLESAIQKDPDDLSAWAVYADWLQTMDDPRGEILALDLAFQAESTEVRKRKEELKLVHQESSIVELQKIADLKAGEGKKIKLKWFGGFIRKVELPVVRTKHPPAANEKMLIAILEPEISKFLLELNLQTLNSNILQRLTQGPALPALQHLVLREHG